MWQGCGRAADVSQRSPITLNFRRDLLVHDSTKPSGRNVDEISGAVAFYADEVDARRFSSIKYVHVVIDRCRKPEGSREIIPGAERHQANTFLFGEHSEAVDHFLQCSIATRHDDRLRLRSAIDAGPLFG